MKILFALALFTFSPSLYAFTIGCTTETTSIEDVFTSKEGTPSEDQITKVCICRSKVQFTIVNETTGKTQKINYRIHEAKQDVIAGLEEVYLSVTGEGYDVVGFKNFFMTEKYPWSTEFLVLRGKLWKGIIFTADFDAERTSCSKN